MIAKRKVDNKSFFGKNLHVSYAPEFESVEDTREKLEERKATIAHKTKQAHAKAQRERKLKEQQQRHKEAAERSELQSPPGTVVAESPPQLGHVAVNIPIPIPVTFDPPLSSSLPPSSQSPSSQSQGTSRLLHSGPQVGITGDPMLHPHYQVPPLPPPTFHGMPTPQYPSQAIEKIMGGASPLTSRHGKPWTHPSKRDGSSKRQPSGSEGLSGEKGGHVLSGLTTSERVSAYLSNSEAKSDPSAKESVVGDLPVKKKACVEPPIREKEQKPNTRDVSAVQHQPELNRNPVPSEGYFPVPKLPPLQTGSRSIDTSVQAVRSQMSKVWDEGTHTPTIVHHKRPKKRKRI